MSEDSPRCFNCLDVVYMDEVGIGLYRCPVCGDEYDAIYADEDDDDIYDGLDDESEDYDNVHPLDWSV